MAGGKKKAQPSPVVSEPTPFQKRFAGSIPLGQQGEWMQWDKIGQDIAGEFLGVVPFKDGHKTTMRNEEGKIVVFSTPAVLYDVLRTVKVGTGLAIRYSGTKPATTRNPDGSARDPIKLFEVLQLTR